MDFSKLATVLATERIWITSPANDVSRVQLEREAEETGYTSSFVRFAPGSSFPEYTQPQGEELYVFDGVFSDENGDYRYDLLMNTVSTRRAADCVIRILASPHFSPGSREQAQNSCS